MAKSEWDRKEWHPSPELLLRHWECELPESDRTALEEHLRTCWDCSAELETLKRGIWSFMEFREKVLLPSVPDDPAVSAARLPLIEGCVVEQPRPAAWMRPITDFFRLVTGDAFRPAWIAGLVSVAAVFAFLYFSTLSPAPLLASEFIQNVQTSLVRVQESEHGRIVRQKIRVRSGGLVAEREVVHASSLVSAAPARSPLWAADMPALISWEDPLNFDSFLHWRARQTSFREDVSAADDGYLTLHLTVTGSESGVSRNVRDVFVTVRKLDWHVTRKRVEFQSGLAIEAVEVAWTVTDPPLSIAVPKLAKPSNSVATRMASPVSPADLDRAEIRVREILFRDRSDLAFAEVPPSLIRTQGLIQIKGVISDSTARSEISEALAPIPHVSDEIGSNVILPSPVHSSGHVHAIVPTPVSSEEERIDPPLLRQKLIETLGSEQQATRFANQILGESGKSFSLSVQYHELAKRFSEADEKRLPAVVKIELGNLSREMENALRTQLESEAVLLAPILGSEHRGEARADSDWHRRADTLFELATRKQKTVSLLFAVTSHSALEKTSAEAELGQLRDCVQQMAASIP